MTSEKIIYESVLDLIIIGSAGMYLTTFEAIANNISNIQRFLFPFITITAIFSISYCYRKFFIYNKFSPKEILIFLLLMIFLIIVYINA